MDRNEMFIRLIVLTVLWGLFLCAALYDPMVICGISFPLIATGMVLKD